MAQGKGRQRKRTAMAAVVGKGSHRKKKKELQGKGVGIFRGQNKCGELQTSTVANKPSEYCCEKNLHGSPPSKCHVSPLPPHTTQLE